MVTLLHICCGPCATETVAHWREAGHDVTGFFFNPNIHPFMEYRRRLTGAEELATSAGFELRLDETYDPARWFTEVRPQEPDRCRRCIGARMHRAAREAAATGCDAFTTSLAISPWQDRAAIAEEGLKAAQAVGVAFLYEDLRPRYRGSREAAKQLGLYRQKYCGCVLSEWERYRRKTG